MSCELLARETCNNNKERQKKIERRTVIRMKCLQMNHCLYAWFFVEVDDGNDGEDDDDDA